MRRTSIKGASNNTSCIDARLPSSLDNATRLDRAGKRELLAIILRA